LNSLLAVYDRTTQDLSQAQANASNAVSNPALVNAQDAMDKAVGALRAYTLAHSGKGATPLANDPQFQGLNAQANARTQDFLAISEKAQTVAVAQAAVPEVQRIVFRIMDPPAAAPNPFSIKAKAVRLVGFGVPIMLVVGLLGIYVVARRDPRLRSVDDVRRLGIRIIGTLPAARVHA
jgi:hypothetical protein